MTHESDILNFASAAIDHNVICDAAVQTDKFCLCDYQINIILCNAATQTVDLDCLPGLNMTSDESYFEGSDCKSLLIEPSNTSSIVTVINKTDINIPVDLDGSNHVPSCDVEDGDISPKIAEAVNTINMSQLGTELQHNSQFVDQTLIKEGEEDDTVVMPLLCPSGIECLLDTSQIVIHTGNLRHDIFLNIKNIRRMEAISEMRRILFYIEQDPLPPLFKNSFLFRIYNRNKEEVMQVLNPASNTCIACGLNWHWFKFCQFEAVVYSPPGTVAGFIKRRRTCLVQEFQILGPCEEVLLRLRGSPNDLKIYSVDLLHELGRLSIHGWVGVMHEIRRTANDYGLTFPIDLDVHVKGLLLSSVIAIDWLYSNQGGR